MDRLTFYESIRLSLTDFWKCYHYFNLNITKNSGFASHSFSLLEYCFTFSSEKVLKSVFGKVGTV